MDLKELEKINFNESIITKLEQVGNDIVLEFLGYGCIPTRIVFSNAKVNEDIEPRLAVNLLEYAQYIKSRKIEIYDVDYGKLDNNNYYFKLYLLFVPKEWFDYSKLKIKPKHNETLEEPIMSFIATNISFEIDNELELDKKENDDINALEYRNNLDKINNINFHDGDIYNYEREDKNISFELKDGWLDCLYYKVELENVSVQVMNNNPEYICWTLDRFNNFVNDDILNLYSGEVGSFIDSSGINKYYLKLWIRHPNVFNINCKVTSSGYKFDGMDVKLCNDYDDTGMLYIKFIADNINVIELYPLLGKYSRVSNENMDNLYKYKDYLGENEYKFFSAMQLTHVFMEFSYIDNELKFKFRDILNLNDTFTLSFINVSSELNEIDIDSFIANTYDNERKLSNCIRFIEYKNNKYVIGLLLSMEEEFIFTCDNIVFDGNKIDSKSILD